jgi:uncharacterized membrane protein HdeD (DUF308 family)
MESRGPAVENWWLLAIGGLFSILFGLLLIFWPGITLIVQTWIFGIYAIAYGFIELVNVFRSRETWWAHLLIGLISLFAGILVVAWPGISTVVLLYFIAFWALGVGIAEVLTGLFQAQFGLIVAGLIAVLFGILMLTNITAGALALAFVMGIFAIVLNPKTSVSADRDLLIET